MRSFIGYATSGMKFYTPASQVHHQNSGRDHQTTSQIVTPRLNQKHSEQRVMSVLDYLLTNFTGLDKKQFVTRGYGLSRPIADNKTEAGMAANRRVEFVVLNKGELKKEIGRRRLLKKGENVPIETSAPPDTTQ